MLQYGLILGFALFFIYKKLSKKKLTRYSKGEIRKIQERLTEQSNPDINPDLKMLKTDKTYVSDGMDFVICRVTEQIKIKPNNAYNFRKDFSKDTNPFMGKLKENLVISRSFNHKHRLLLNRYSILEKQLLIVAKPSHFETQSIPLDFYDFEGVFLTMKVLENPICFFNGGAHAGASQPHKHLQAIPLESFNKIGGCALDKSIQEYYEQEKAINNLNEKHKLPIFNFKHEIRFFDKQTQELLSEEGSSQEEAVGTLLELYKDIFKSLRVNYKNPENDTNVVITKRYLMVIVRNTFSFENIRKVANLPPYRPNTMCYLGLFYSKTEATSKKFQEIGMMHILNSCGQEED